MALGISKWGGLKRLSERLGVPRERKQFAAVVEQQVVGIGALPPEGVHVDVPPAGGKADGVPGWMRN